jgi:hypothetical protein
LLLDHSYPLPNPSAFGHHVVTEDHGTAAGWREESGEHLDRRGLACSVGPEESEDLGLPDIEGDVVHRGLAVEVPREVSHLNGELVGQARAAQKHR